jgi:hypothetical protein
MLFSENQVMDIKARKIIGDTLISNETEAEELQRVVEKALRTKLNFQIHKGDLVLARFDQIPKQVEIGKMHHSIGHSYVSKDT